MCRVLTKLFISLVVGYCLYTILRYNTIVNFVCVLHPLLLHQVVFWGCSTNQRFQTANQELIHLLKIVVFESFEVAYLTCFLPVKFVKSTLLNPSEEVFID